LVSTGWSTSVRATILKRHIDLVILDPFVKTHGIEENANTAMDEVISGKVNIAPPSKNATWFKLVGVPLGNSSELYPSGDNVQTVERWKPPETFEGLTADRVLACIFGARRKP